MANSETLSFAACPPPVQTFSFGNSPVRVEHPSQSSHLPTSISNHHQEWCDAAAVNGLWRLEWVYGYDIQATLIEGSSSLVVRSEHQFNLDERRLSLRKHFYEIDQPRSVGSDDPRTIDGERALRHRTFSGGEQFGRYLGFLDLRETWSQFPLAMGILATPKSYLHDPATTIITTECGPIFGGPAFPASVYVMHDPVAGGAYCSQVVVIMALGLLVDRGARIVGSHTLTYLAQPNRRVANGAADAPPCDTLHKQPPPSHNYAADSLNAWDCYIALGSAACSTSPSWIQYTCRKKQPDTLTGEIIKAYIDARYPVILAVDAHWWSSKLNASNNGVGHAVLVIGYRKNDQNRLSLICHDPGIQPFFPRELTHAIDAAWMCGAAPAEGGVSKESLAEKGFVTLIPVADRRVKTHLHECISWLRSSHAEQFFRHYAPSYAGVFEKYAAAEAGGDFRLRCGLIDPDHVQHFFMAPAERRVLDQLEDHCRALPGRRCWALCGYYKGHLRLAWMFSAERARGTPGFRPDLILSVNGNVVERVFQNLTRELFDEAATANPTVTPRQRTGPPPAKPLLPSVMTSCSRRPLKEFLVEMDAVSGTRRFEIFLLREDDLDRLVPGDNKVSRTATANRNRTAKHGRPNNPILQFLASPRSGFRIASWIASEFRAAESERVNRPVPQEGVQPLKISALATYIPWITCLDTDLRKQAIEALALQRGFGSDR